MKENIINLFSFLNKNEDRFDVRLLAKLTTIDDFKKFKSIPKKELDILICKKGFNPDNKELIHYFKSLGGSDDLLKRVKNWLDNRFKNLNIYTTHYNKHSLFYGYDIDNILIEYDYNTNYTSVGINTIRKFESFF